MNFDRKWIILAVSVAALGGWACGSDSKGGGGKSGNICDEDSSSYDADACDACEAAAMQCYNDRVCQTEGMTLFSCGVTKCDSEAAAVEACENAADDTCDSKHPDDIDAYFACLESACAAQNAAVDSCVRSKCSSEASAYISCFKSGCPEAVACTDFT